LENSLLIFSFPTASVSRFVGAFDTLIIRRVWRSQLIVWSAIHEASRLVINGRQRAIQALQPCDDWSS